MRDDSGDVEHLLCGLHGAQGMGSSTTRPVPGSLWGKWVGNGSKAEVRATSHRLSLSRPGK